MKSEFDELKRFAIADILSVSGRQKTTETVDMHINTIIDIAFLKGQQSQQSKIDELQKRVDAVKQLIEDYRDPPTEDKTFQHALSIVADELEQALKGGEDASN